VSLDGLPAGHLRVLLDGLSVFEQHGLLLAGGYAFRAHEILYLPSQDLDFATGNHEPLPEIAAHVRQAFASAGYGTRVVEATGRYARPVLRLPGSGDELEMDLLKEALGPGGITVQLAGGASVRAVALDDAVGLKARAWHDRFVIRDIIDLHAAADAFSYADIENLARRHDGQRRAGRSRGPNHAQRRQSPWRARSAACECDIASRCHWASARLPWSQSMASLGLRIPRGQSFT
jgi:hypothetical protein